MNREKNTFELRILGQRFVIRSEECEDYIRGVEEYLNKKIGEVKEKTRAVSNLDLAILTALTITGELIKSRNELDDLGKRSEELSKLIDRKASNL